MINSELCWWVIERCRSDYWPP